MKRLFLYTLTWFINSDMVMSNSPLDKINHVGCYDLEYSLGNNFHHKMVGVTIDNCVNFCCKRNTKYAGVEQSDDFCYCGEDIAEESIKRNDSLCNVRCSEKDNMLCGGAWVMSLYDISGACGASSTPNSDVDHVRFLVAVNAGVRLYQEYSEDYDLLHTNNGWTHTVDYHFSKNLVFFVDDEQLYKTTFQPVSPDSAVSNLHPIRDMTHCEGFAVDWVSDHIYWADCNNNNIMSMDLDGKRDTVILNRTEELGNIKQMEVDPYRGMLFWTTYGIIESCKLGDVTKFDTNLSRAGVIVRAFTLDMAARRVYYVEKTIDSGILYSMNYQGGNQQEIRSMVELNGVHGLGFLNGNIYWVEFNVSGDLLYKSSLTDPHSVQMLTPTGEFVWHMKVVHPSLQQRPNVLTDPCEDKPCSHGCVVESPTSATCQCPDNQTLDTDGITCTVIVGAASSIRSVNSVSIAAILLAILLVMVIVMVSGLLLFLADKYWSHLHTKFSGASYTRKRHGVIEDESNYHASTIFDSTEDNVVLVS